MRDMEHILKLFRDRGHSEYGGEAVTQLQHALQCALLAEEAEASSSLIAAALLHDIGHLVHALPENAPDHGVDDSHEELGFRYLKSIFDESVTEPVRLHVHAKRYLCATNVDYADQLSRPSIVSLGLQGGPMSAAEVGEFESGRFAQDAVQLRRWDDTAKVCGLVTPDIGHFVQHLQIAASRKETQ